MKTIPLQTPQRAGPRCLPAVALSMLVLCLPAAAQPHQVARDGYTLRASTVVSTALDPATAKAHGIEPSADRGVLNVSVRTGSSWAKDVPADVHAEVRNLAGMQREVRMREAPAPNGMVSYLGTYEFAPREVLDFRVTARPRGSSTELALEFRDRMPVAR